jgi:hypothetical protein
VAIICMFYGIIISMYYMDNRQHHFPHIHISYQGQEAVIGIDDGEIIEGEIKKNKLRLVQAWIELHRDELKADWELAIKGENVFRIDPLK